MCAGPKLRWLYEYRFSSGSLYILQNGGKLALIANCGIPNNRPLKIEKNRFVNEKRNGVTCNWRYTEKTEPNVVSFKLCPVFFLFYSAITVALLKLNYYNTTHKYTEKHL